MIQAFMPRIAVFAVAVLLAGPQTARGQSAPPVQATEASVARARADSIRRPYTQADVDFMTGMVHHHAQAILMARLAPDHGASSTIQTLSARIINAQQDEIRAMQQWLADRRLPVPTPNPYGMPMTHGGTQHEMLMPGMITRDELARLDSARGPMFDLLLLQSMVRHHEGAIGMVRQLFATPGAGQDEAVFRLASDINADQTSEVARMRRMITALVIGGPF